MGAPGLKARYVDVYLPSETAKRQWEEDAKEVGLPLSKFVYETVEAFCSAKKEKPRSDFIKELAEIKEEVQKLRSELKLKNMLLEKSWKATSTKPVMIASKKLKSPREKGVMMKS
jgi:hypothetical protein